MGGAPKSISIIYFSLMLHSKLSILIQLLGIYLWKPLHIYPGAAQLKRRCQLRGVIIYTLASPGMSRFLRQQCERAKAGFMVGVLGPLMSSVLRKEAKIGMRLLEFVDVCWVYHCFDWHFFLFAGGL